MEGAKRGNRKLKTDRRFEQHFVGVNAVMKQVKCEQLKGTFDWETTVKFTNSLNENH